MMIWSHKKKSAAVSTPTDGEKEACKTYLEQTKLLVTLSSAFLIAPAGLVSFFSERIGVGIGGAGLNLLMGAEAFFVASVLSGYVVMATLSGSQQLNSFNVFRPATRWSSIIQLVLYLLGLLFFVLLARVLLFSATTGEQRQQHQPPRIDVPVVVLPRAAVESPIAIYSFWFDLASSSNAGGKGVTLSTEQHRILKLIVRGLIACNGSGRGQQVEIGFRGFSDSNLFRTDHAKLNREVANRRATELRRLVAADLSKMQGSTGIVVRDTALWPDEQIMTSAVGYVFTRPLAETGASIDQGQWDRRADLVVWKLGTCPMAPVAGDSK